MVVDIDYGNARLRAARSRLLTTSEYERLVSVDSMDGLIAALSGTTYAADLDAALPRFRGLRRFDEVVTGHLVRILGPIPRYYGVAGEGVIGVLLDRWDLRNLQAVIRGRARFEAADEILRLVVPIGRLSGAELAELAMQPSLRYVIDLMVAWQIPSPEAARTVRRAWPEYEATGDVLTLEMALNRAFALRRAEVLGDDETQAALVLRSEVDEVNLLTALRLRSARRAGEIAAPEAASFDHYLPGGRVGDDILAGAAVQEDRSAVIERLERATLLPGWTQALHAWVEDGDLVRLAEELRLGSTRFAVGLFSRGDPLGLDVPVAFTRAQEHEARNLRWIGRGIAHGLAVAEIEAKVVVVR